MFAPTKLTVAEYLEQWRGRLEAAGRNPATVAFYLLMSKHPQPYVGAMPLPRLTPARIQVVFDKAHGEKTSRVLKGMHDTLSAAMTQAVRLGLVKENPCRRVQPPSHKPKEAQALTAEQARAFLRAARDQRLYALWLPGVTTALRRGELCGLRWQDVDLDAGRLSVQQELLVVDGKRVFKEPKSTASQAAVPLLPEAVQALRDWQTVQNVEKATAGPLWEEHGDGLVFCQANGWPLHPNNLLKRDFRGLLAKTGLDGKLRIHDLRHAVSTVLIGGGVDRCYAIPV